MRPFSGSLEKRNHPLFNEALFFAVEIKLSRAYTLRLKCHKI
jgi:hypothetical protein